MDLKELSQIINRIMLREKILGEKIEEVFDFIFKRKLKRSFLCILVAIHTKGESKEDLIGLAKSLRKLTPVKDIGIDADKVIDVSSTGASKLKVGNISTTVSFILSAHEDIYVCKQSFFGITSASGSADLLNDLGINVMAFNYKKIENALKEHRIAFYNIFSIAESHEVIDTINEIAFLYNEEGTKITTPMNLIAPLSNFPVPSTNRLYGVYNKKFLDPLYDTLNELGFKNCIVCSSEDGLDEASNFSTTHCLGKQGKFEISPKELDLPKAIFEDVKQESRESSTKDFIRILYGIERGPKRDLVVLNSALGFYVMNMVGSLKEGIIMAEKIIDDGKAKDKLNKFVQAYGDL